LITSNHLALFPFFLKIFTPFYFAAPACLYLYFTGFINDRTNLRRSDWLHFIPVAFAIIHVLPWHLSPPIQWNVIAKQIAENRQLFINQRTGLFPAYSYYGWLSLLMLGYLFATWRAVLTSRIVKQKEWDINKTWIFFSLITATLFKLIGILPLIFENLHQPLVSYTWFAVANSLVLLMVIVFILHQPRLLYGYLLVGSNWKGSNPETRQPERMVIASPKSNLPTGQISAYRQAMEEFIVNEKPFLLPDFQIVHIAQKLNIPVHHCSFVINNVIGKNFRDWINGYRINNFTQEYPLLADKMTIEAIAYKSGFKSVATFYNAFKKETGLMPTAYFLKKEQKVS
jgi:AraC-like DNA-binding protein